MRLLHTSDWHLGHTLKDVTREREHAAFLAWLLATCAREAPDVLVITGDVFDSATPPASAERMWFEFLAAARRARPAMDIVAIAGNHDSPARLGAASAVLRELGVHVVGALPRREDGTLDLDRILIPVAGGRGLVAAVPFVRAIDVPADCEDPLGAIYGDVIAAARERRAPGQALVVLGHLYIAGAEPSQLSERRVSIGGQEAAPLRHLLGDRPDDIDYVALGHLHRAQRVGRDTVRYAGAPLALALDEGRYRHSIAIYEAGAVRLVDVPRLVDIVQIEGSLEEVRERIAALPPLGDEPRPYLEVVVRLARPEPRLRSIIETALDGKHARLVQLRAESTGDGAALADRVSARRLAELDPREVFERLWARGHSEPPGEAVLAAFDRLRVEVEGSS
ncbi:MAG TPA: exonuclease SbcCD subunit D C-terminal domain-containing protein [Kofleriaceae bacterium]|nr:exonuclease SbcCD subunit D C-terminal domain-containing protein [Kofleriaceae bacterium]